MITKPRQFSLLAAAILAATPLFAAPANAQVVYQPAPPVPIAPQPAAVPLLSNQQLDELTAPIALYPDPILAQLLPAATFPQDVADAAGFINTHPNATDDLINAQPWDPSVKAIAHYPSILLQMGNNLEWTQALGAAFINQPQDVMNSIQRLRAAAQSAGSLATNQYQQIVGDQGDIQIVPTNAQLIYIPTYNPALVYSQNAALTFGPGFRFGLWLNNGFDWGHHWVTRDFDWAHFRDHRNDRRPEVLTHPWVRDDRRPAPVMPPHYVQRAPAVRPGYEKAAPARGSFNPNEHPQDIQRAEQRGRAEVPHPAAPTPRPVAPAPRPVERPAPRPAEPAPRPIAPAPRPIAPAPRPIAPAPRPVAPAPRPVAPAPRPIAPAPRPAAPAAPAFHPDGGDNGAGAADTPPCTVNLPVISPLEPA